jgi:HK97 gp10 family phage protein
MSIRVTGLVELKRRFSRLEPKLQKNVLRGAVRAVAAEVRDDARSRTPVDSGNLRKNIISKSTRSRRHQVSAGVVIREEGKRVRLREKGGALSIVVSQRNAFYWRFLEYGTVFMKKKQPFIRPAYDSMRGRAVQVMTAYMRGRIDRALRP